MNTISKTRLITVFIISAGLFTMAIAQEKTTSSKYSGGFGHFAFAYESVNLSQLNSSLKKEGYGTVPLSYPSFGGAGYLVIHNFLIGAGGASLLGYTSQRDSNITSISSGYGFGALGYVFSSGKRSFFYPNIGIGGGGFSLQTGKNGHSTDFEQQLHNPRGRFFSEAGGVFYNLQLAWQIMLGSEDKAGWSLGFKAGYKFTSSDWSLDVNGQKNSGNPKVSLAGYYLSVTLGGGAIFAGH